MKFHAITDPSIDGYITWGSWEEKHKLFRGQPWEVCPVPLDVDYALPSPETIAAFRKPYGDAFILGTLARAEKMSDPEYLEAVADILLDNPNCVFLWAGRSPLPAIVEYFERRGVGQRCHFIGWVDTKLVSACFDAFLEPFPFGYGFTGFQALKAGTPLLSYVGKHTIFGVQFWDYESNPQGKPPANSAQSPVLAASSKEEYRQLAGRLVRDAEFRTAVIASEQAYFNERIANMEQYAERFFSTVHAIALRKLAGNHP